MGDHEHPRRPAKGLAMGQRIKRRQPGFPEPRRHGNEGLLIALGPNGGQRSQGFHLPRARGERDGSRGGSGRGWRGLTVPHTAQRCCLRGPGRVALDDGGRQLRGLLPEVVEGSCELTVEGVRAGRLADEVPFHPRLERRSGEVARPDDDDPAGGIGNPPRLGMKRRGGATEVFKLREASFEGRASEVDPAQQKPQGGGGGDAEVVAHKKPHPRPGSHRTEQRLAHVVEPRGLHERREEIDLARPRKPVGQPMPERALGASREREPRRLGRSDGRPRQIIPLLGDHVPHAAPRIGHVAGVARDHVDMHMRHGLAGGGATVEADVIAIGLGIEPLVQELLHVADEVHERRLLFARALEERRHHPPRDHEHMPRRHRIRIEDRKRQMIGADPLRRGDGKERRGGSGIHGRKCRSRPASCGPDRTSALGAHARL